MIRISKLADYGSVILAYLIHFPQHAHNAREIAKQTHIALPMVSKVLKLLTQHGLLISQRGAKGGYALALPAEKISLADVIQALEGKVGLTECSHGLGICQVEDHCRIRHHWLSINSVIQAALAKVSLADFAKTAAAVRKR